MARNEMARESDTKSLLSRRGYLKLAGASVATVAGLGTATAGAKEDGVILQEDFSSSDYDQYFTHAWRLGEYDQVSTEYSQSGGSSLYVDLPEGSHYGMDATVDPKDAGLLDSNTQEMYASYWVKFDSDFGFGDDRFACKLPGFQNHERREESEPSDGTNGWAARGLYKYQDGQICLGYYCYHMDQSGRYGDNFEATTVGRGEWHHVEQYVKLNTVSGDSANRDGVLTMWVDGDRKVHRTNMAYTLAPDRGVNYAFQVYYGGGDPSPANNHICIDNWTLATSKPDTQKKGDLLEVVSNTGTEALEYDFTVDGHVSKKPYPSDLGAEVNDTITDNGDGTMTVTGVSGNGYGDSYWVDGSVTSMTIDESNWTIRYNGQEVAVADIVESPGPVLDRFGVSKSEQLGADRMFSVQWAVSSDEGLDSVEVVAVRNTADMNFSVTDASGASASGWELFQFPVGTELDVSLRAEDTAGNVTKETKSITL